MTRGAREDGPTPAIPSVPPVTPPAPEPRVEAAPSGGNRRAAARTLTWREARRRRRTARRRGEEILAWFVVPVILFGLYWGITATLDFFGTTPGQIWDQAMQVKAALEKKQR